MRWTKLESGVVEVEAERGGLPWRCVVAPGDEALARELLGEAAEDAIAAWTPEQIKAARPAPPGVVPPQTLEDAKALALARLAERRWRAETGGILVDGAAVATDRESQGLIQGAVIGAQLKPEQVVNWKGRDGWLKLDAAAVAGLARAVRDHVQACFDLERAKAAEIAALETAQAVEAWLETELQTGWPK